MKKRMSKMFIIMTFLLAPICIVHASEESTEIQPEITAPIEVGKDSSIVIGAMIPIKVNKTGLLQITTATGFPKNINASLYETEMNNKPFVKGKLNKDGTLTFSVSKKGTFCLKITSEEESFGNGIEVKIKSKITPDTNLVLKKGKWVNGYYNVSKKKPIYYKITVTSNGIVKIAAKKNTKIVLYNSTKTTPLSKIRTLNKANQYKSMFALKKGSYYIKTTSDEEIIPMTYSYSHINSKAGKKIDQARSLKLGASYIKGMIAETDTASTAHWYKFKLTKKKKVTINILPHVEGTRLKVQIYDNKKKLLSSGSIILNDNEFLISKSPGKWNKGTYYIKITKSSNYGSGYYNLKVK